MDPEEKGRDRGVRLTGLIALPFIVFVQPLISSLPFHSHPFAAPVRTWFTSVTLTHMPHARIIHTQNAVGTEQPKTGYTDNDIGGCFVNVFIYSFIYSYSSFLYSPAFPSSEPCLLCAQIMRFERLRLRLLNTIVNYNDQ